MTSFEWASIALGIVASIGVPILAMLVRLTVRFTQMSDRLDGLAEDMRQDREATDRYRVASDRRLRWLEETFWQRRR